MSCIFKNGEMILLNQFWLIQGYPQMMRLDCTEYLISPLVYIYMITSSYNNISDSKHNSFLVSLKAFKVDIKFSSFLGYPVYQ